MTAAKVVGADAQQRIAWIGGSTHDVALGAADTEGRLTVLRSTQRAGAGSPVHVHPDEDEALVLLTGAAVVWAGGDRWTAGAGDAVFLPRGLPHTYLVTADAEVLTICTPSGMERFFADAGWDLAQGPPPPGWSPDRDALAAAAERGGQRLLGPPLAADDEMPAHLREPLPG